MVRRLMVTFLLQGSCPQHKKYVLVIDSPSSRNADKSSTYGLAAKQSRVGGSWERMGSIDPLVAFEEMSIPMAWPS